SSQCGSLAYSGAGMLLIAVFMLAFFWVSLENAMERDLFNEDKAWRKKSGSILHGDSIMVKHIKTVRSIDFQEIGSCVSPHDNG
ncbi:hypothetical protein HAX54_038647, partial [Datura stramonium]|nr:hypothetical protein [Datura stramonium]